MTWTFKNTFVLKFKWWEKSCWSMWKNYTLWVFVQVLWLTCFGDALLNDPWLLSSQTPPGWQSCCQAQLTSACVCASARVSACRVEARSCHRWLFRSPRCFCLHPFLCLTLSLSLHLPLSSSHLASFLGNSPYLSSEPPVLSSSPVTSLCRSPSLASWMLRWQLAVWTATRPAVAAWLSNAGRGRRA